VVKLPIIIGAEIKTFTRGYPFPSIPCPDSDSPLRMGVPIRAGFSPK